MPAFVKQSFTKRTTPLSEGYKLCGLILAICAAPLFKVTGWMAVWLLAIMTIVGLGTFGLWFVRTIQGKSEPTEEHTENMAAISLLGQNREGKSPIIAMLANEPTVENPAMNQGEGA